MSAPKITFIGAGSTVFVKNILGDVFQRPALKSAHIALMDIDETRLEESHIVVRKLMDSVGANGEISCHRDRKTALQGGFPVAVAADFAVRAHGIHQLAHHDMRLFQPGFIDIHQRDMRRFQRRALENITENIFDEHRRTGADKSNFWGRHHALSIRSLNTCRVARRSPLRCPVPAGAFPKAQIGH